jgi:hypothetical protein
VRNIAPQIEVIKTAFPDVKFGDVEPVSGVSIGKMKPGSGSADLRAFPDFASRSPGYGLSFAGSPPVWRGVVLSLRTLRRLT